MQCKICGKEFNGKLNSFGYHLSITHKIKYKEYYDIYLKSPTDGICVVCGNPTNWRRNCYLLCCSTKCGSIYSKNKRESTMIDRYGAKTTLESKTLRNKVESTNKEKYGLKNPGAFGTDIFKKAMIDKYGVDSYLKTYTPEQKTIYGKLGHTEEANINYKNTMLNLYGVEHPMQSHDIFNKIHKKYTYDNKIFDSSWELAYYIWLTDHNIDFEYQPDVPFKYVYNNIEHNYFPDFKVNAEYQELKGLQFFEDKNILKKMINPYDSTQNELYEAKHQCMLKNNVKIITDCTEYIKYVEEKYTKDFIPLFKNDLPFPYLNEDLRDTSDMGLIHHFHKSIYEATRKDKLCPIDAWQDKNIIKKVALNRLKYVGSCKPSDILQGFNVTKIAAKISVFKPSLAKNLIEKYLNEYEEIFDPFSGFSGRLIGAELCHKKYIGQDINEKHVFESNEIIKYKNYSDSTVNVQDILTDINKSYECLFTCPPYGGKEHWNKDNDEIEKSCDEWIDICLKNYKCKEYLFVVDNTEKYKNNIVETIENKSHFGINYEYVILIKNQN